MNRSVLFPSLVVTLGALSLFATTNAQGTDLIPEVEAAYSDGAVAPLGTERIERDYAYEDVEIALGGLTRGPRPPVDPSFGPGAGGQGHSSAKNPEQARQAGVDWLEKVQHNDGGWGAGTWGTDDLAAPSDVATTSYVTLALLRDANGTDEHDKAIERGVTFIVEAVENAPSGARLRTPEGTQPQYKLGQLVDTHFASLVFGEIYESGRISAGLNERVGLAYDMVLWKVQHAQNADGSFDANGWAPVLSSSIAAQGLYKAQLLGRDVDDAVMERSDAYQAGLASSDGTASTGEAAGVELYAVASGLRGNDQTAKREQREGRGEGDRATEAEETAQATRSRVAQDASGALVSGFGSIGGEEMLSYQMISDTLAEDGGKDWTQWEVKMGDFLTGIQNADGSWSGHHCITSTVFVTAGAVMTLSAGDYAAKAKTRRAGGTRNSG